MAEFCAQNSALAATIIAILFAALTGLIGYIGRTHLRTISRLEHRLEYGDQCFRGLDNTIRRMAIDMYEMCQALESIVDKPLNCVNLRQLLLENAQTHFGVGNEKS